MSVEDPAGQFTDLLIQTAESTCFSSKNFPKFHGLMIIARKQLRKERKHKESCVFFSNPTLSNIENFKLLRAKAHHVVKQQKKNL